jgi:hypothetical protein
MTCDEHSKQIGKIVVNLQSLEIVLRLFLSAKAGENAQLPLPGDTTVPETWLTNYKSLGNLVGVYNAELTSIESPRFAVDETVVTVRDALAHGRIMSPTPSPPFTLFKFGKPKKGIVAIKSIDELTAAWLSAKITLTRDQIIKVTECAHARGHEWQG